MPPSPTWFRGREAFADFLANWPLEGKLEWRLVPVQAAGQIAFASYARRDGAGAYVVHSIDVLTLDGELIAELTAFRDPEILGRFGLPAEIQH
jgi:RNA polymerase sigma-70 factor (ECF subfamily)